MTYATHGVSQRRNSAWLTESEKRALLSTAKTEEACRAIWARRVAEGVRMPGVKHG